MASIYFFIGSENKSISEAVAEVAAYVHIIIAESIRCNLAFMQLHVALSRESQAFAAESLPLSQKDPSLKSYCWNLTCR